jgi:diaminopimelate epimerase
MKVWERGCGVTLACGTGSCASTVTGILHDKLDRIVTVHLDGGKLQVEWNQSNNHVYMTGPCTEVFEGEYYVEKR